MAITKEVSANNFYDLWLRFITKKITINDKWNSLYQNDRTWSNIILGNKQSSTTDSPLGQFINNETGLLYRREDGLADLGFSFNNKFNKIEKIHWKKPFNKDFISFDGKFYPDKYDILLEHENSITKCWEEMVKLTYFRAKLKVLITYNRDAQEGETYDHVFKTLCSNFKNIIKQSQTKISEAKKTEYLLIVGQNNNNKELIWKHTVVR